MVETTTGKLSEIFCFCLTRSRRVGGRDSVNKRMGKGGLNRAWCNVLGNVAKGVMFLIDLQ